MTKEISAYSASLRLDVGSSNQLCSICEPRGWRNRKHRYVSAANESAQTFPNFKHFAPGGLCTCPIAECPFDQFVLSQIARSGQGVINWQPPTQPIDRSVRID